MYSTSVILTFTLQSSTLYTLTQHMDKSKQTYSSLWLHYSKGLQALRVMLLLKATKPLVS